MIRYYNSSRIGPLNVTDQAGLNEGVDELLWTVNNITLYDFTWLAARSTLADGFVSWLKREHGERVRSIAPTAL